MGSEDTAPPRLPLVSRKPAPGVAVPSGGAEPRGAPDDRAGLIARLARPACGLAATVYIARKLGPSSAGVYVLALAIGTAALYVGWTVLPGLVRGVGNLGARATDRSQAPGRRPASPTSCALAVALVLGVIAGPVADGYHSPALAWPLRWVAVLVAAQALTWALEGRARRRPTSGRVIGELVVQAVATVLLVSRGAGVAGAALALALGYLVPLSALGAGAWIGRDAPAGPRASNPLAVDRLTETDLAWLTSFGLATIVVAAVVSPSSFGRFGCALALAAALGAIGRGVASRRPTDADLARRVKFAARAQGLVLAGLIVWADPLMRLLFESRSAAGAATLRLLCVAAFVAPLAWLIAVAVARLPRVRDRAVVSALSFEVGVCATYLLATVHGTAGGAAGADVVMILCLIGNLWLGRAALDLEPLVLVRTLVRITAAATAMAAVMYAVGTRDLTAVGWIGGAVGGSAAYLAVLLATAEVSLTGSVDVADPAGPTGDRLRPPTDAPGPL